MEKKKIVFLYTEIATYFLACVEALIQYYNVEVHIVRYAINKEAPFIFEFPKNVSVYERNLYKDEQLVNLVTSFSPDLIVCSGWIDKGYLQVCKIFKSRAITVLTLDNHWKGTLKQYLASLLSPFYLHRRFTYCWVPGKPQYLYAKHLGFKEPFILTGFYSCDVTYFNDQFKMNKLVKEIDFPRRFIYVGRYVEAKGVQNLWKAFIELQEECPNDWELWCLGTGNITPIQHPKIKHAGFVQPSVLADYIKQTGVFVLPSHFEPWGVVIHEFAAAGFPVVCSSEVGAHSTFVENDLNGYIYNPQHDGDLKQALKKIMDTDMNSLSRMGEKSNEKAKQITPSIWAKQLISIL